MQLSGNIFDYAVVFASGVVVSFTPCVYPILPITAGFIGGMTPTGSRAQGFWLSLIYVTGMALTYCGLAVLAALTGRVFGQLQNSPWAALFVANVLLIFALMMFDVIPLPVLGMNLQSRIRPRNVGGLLLFGAAAGLIVGPCTAPVLGTLLLYVASRQNILHSVSLLLVFSYGLGTSLILVGTFSGLLTRLPRAGVWLLRVKQFCGLVLLLAGEYYLIRAGRLWG